MEDSPEVSDFVCWLIGVYQFLRHPIRVPITFIRASIAMNEISKQAKALKETIND